MRAARLVLVLMLLAAGAARAQDDKAAARKHFEQGSTLYDLGKFREAAQEYEEAYKYKNDPALLFNIGQAYRGAGATREAITAYRAYLRRMPEARNRAAVEAQIEKLQKQLDEEAAHPPAPVVAPPPRPEPAPPPAVVTPPPAPAPVVTAAPAEKPPLYKRWWLWTIVGGVVVVGVGVGLAVAYSLPNDAPAPANALTVTF